MIQSVSSGSVCSQHSAGHCTWHRHHPCSQVGYSLGGQVGSRSATREAGGVPFALKPKPLPPPQLPQRAQYFGGSLAYPLIKPKIWFPLGFQPFVSVHLLQGVRVKFSSASLTSQHHEEILKLEQRYLPRWSGELNAHRRLEPRKVVLKSIRAAVGTPRDNGEALWVSSSNRDDKFGLIYLYFSPCGSLFE